MDTRDFLAHVLPRTGPYCIVVGFPNGGKWHLPAEDIDEAAAIARQQDRDGRDVYFAVGALIKARTWDEKDQKFRTVRSGTNIRALQSYTFDIDAGNGRAYATTADALEALRQFVQHHKLPEPTTVQSGFGLHVYWTLSEEVNEAEWEAHGTVLSEMAKSAGLLHDSARTKDSSSILRVVGTHNQKYTPPAAVVVLSTGQDTPTAAFHALLGLASPVPIVSAPALLPGNAPLDFGTNTNRYEPTPLDPKKLIKNCQVFRRIADPENQKLGRSAIPEPAWSHAIQLAIHCHNGEQVAHDISRFDARYSKEKLTDKIGRWQAMAMGPASCAKFQEAFDDWGDRYACHGCPSFGKITSPAVVARYIKALPAPIATERQGGVETTRVAPDLPKDYIRTATGLGINVGNPKTGADETLVFCPCDMYPSRIQYDERTNLSKGRWWNVKLPHRDWFETEIPNCSANQLKVVLADRGIDVREPHVPYMANFMSAYVQKLRNDRPSEGTYSQIGWRSDGSFALGDTLYTKTERTTARMSETLIQATQGGIHMEGDFDTWKRAIAFYNRPGLEAFRVYLYTTFASPLYWMTGEVATVVGASGEGGIGKSTLIDVCASVWGDPKAIVDRGTQQGATINGIEGRADAMHSIPLFLDEISDREANDVAKFIFNYSGGKGKLRAKAQGGLRDQASWSNICMVNENADGYARMASVYREADPHFMRFMQLEFQGSDIISKADGTLIKQLAHENYGIAGHVFMEYVVTHQTELKRRIKEYMADIDRQLVSQSKERFWTAWLAACQLAAEVAMKLALLPIFPVDMDLMWAANHITTLRTRVAAMNSDPVDILSEFLDYEVPRTLIIAARSAGNISNVSHEPRGGLNVRHESDVAVAYVSRTALQDYCVEHGANMHRMMRTLSLRGIVTDQNVRKVLGAGTPFAMGSVRCLEVDLKKLGRV